ncbi:type II secretion system protein GspL [Pseudidiomarina atlantica]|nr:type II secretion system protein GspL [Pseudidiomarina atlantica]
MMEQLHIHLGQPLRWLMWHPAHAEVTASGELAELADLAQLGEKAHRCQVTVWLPGQEVVLTEAKLPAGSARLLPQLIPNALEDELASEIEALHFAWPANAKPAGVEQPIPVAIVSRERMQTWLDALQAAGIECDEMYADYFMLPVTENGAQLQLGNTHIVREAQWRGFSIEQPLPFRLEQTDISAHFELPLLAATQADKALAINLRQGDFRAARKRRQMSGSLPWRPLAVAAAAALVMVFAQQWVTYSKLGGEVDALQAAIESTYRDAFPNTTRIVNVRSQLRQQLETVGAASTAPTTGTANGVQLFAQLEPAFRATPDMQLEWVRYNSGTLSLQMRVSEFEALQQFQQVASNSGLQVNQGQVTNQDGVVTGTIEVRAAQAEG